MNRKNAAALHWGRWAAAALLTIMVALLFNLPLLLGRDSIAWPTTLAAGAALAAAVLVLMQDARRRTFAWIAALAVLVFILAVVAHNVEYAITGVEEPSFILLAIVGGPAMLFIGVGGMLWTTVRNRRPGRGAETRAA